MDIGNESRVRDISLGTHYRASARDHAGRSVIAPTGIAEILRERSEGPPKPSRTEVISGLSTREREVFFLTASGMSNADIARSSFISETTVKSHVSSILAKLALTSRIQIVAFAYENNLTGRRGAV